MIFFFFFCCSLNFKCLIMLSSYIFTGVRSAVAIISYQVSKNSVKREEVGNPCYKPDRLREALGTSFPRGAL